MKKEENQFKILIVDDDADYRETYCMLLTAKGYRIATAASAREAMAVLEQEYFPLVISDILMPGIDGVEFLKQVKGVYKNAIEVIMVTGYGSIETVVKTMKMGAFGYFIKSHDPEELVLEIQKVQRIMELVSQQSQPPLEDGGQLLQVSKSKKMQEVWELVDQVASSKANILIQGESGVGKEIVAQRLHRKSGRGNRPFIPMNCQHYPENLIESELFGHEKGAFTGAISKRVGKLEETNGGTIFLDEIGDMDMGTQVKLLRVLETKQIERIGSNKLIDVDFRLISATNKDVYAMVREGSFREDFLYRINTIEVKVPPLRERPEDIEDFIGLFVARFCKETGRVATEIDPATLDYLLHYDYPGNVRELKNMVERMVILSSDGILSLDGEGAWRPCVENGELQEGQPEEKLTGNAPRSEANLAGNRSQAVEGHQELLSYREAKQEFERQYLQEALNCCSGNITKAAAMVGLSRRQLFNKIVELEIHPAD